MHDLRPLNLVIALSCVDLEQKALINPFIEVSYAELAELAFSGLTTDASPASIAA